MQPILARMTTYIDELARLERRIADFQRRMSEERRRLERPDSGSSAVEGATVLDLLTKTARALQARKAVLERLLQQEAMGDACPPNVRHRSSGHVSAVAGRAACGQHTI